MTAPEESQRWTLRPDPAAGAEPDALWRELAAAVKHADPEPDARSLAAWLTEHKELRDQAAPIVARVLHRTLEADAAGDPIARISEFVGHFDVATLAAALRSDLRVPDRAAMLRIAADLLSVRALLRLLEAALGASDRRITPPIKALATKLAREAVRAGQLGSPLAATADRLFRDFMRAAFRSIDPDATARAVASLSRFGPPRERRATGRTAVEPERIVSTALDSRGAGPTLAAAVTEIVDAGGSTKLIEMLKRASGAEENPAVRLVRARIATLTELERQLATDPVDFETVDVIVAGLGIGAAKPLIEALAELTSRATRRGAFSRLAQLGPEIAPLLEPRLRDSRWFVVRNMLALLRAAGVTSDVASVARYTAHADARVRREALMLLVAQPDTRDHAIAEALKDADRHVLRVGLQAARSGLPDTAVPTLTRRLTSGEFPPEFRVLALHLLGRARSTLALDALLHFAQAGRTLIGRPKLAPKSPEMLAALASLARAWPRERRAAALIAAASRSRDAEIRAASAARAPADETAATDAAGAAIDPPDPPDDSADAAREPSAS